MCSYQSITWQIVDNFVTDRMIDNSLIHKFRLSRKVRKRTKVLNAEIKKQCSVKNYKHYVELKTRALRNVVNDDDTSDSSCLTDVDYDIIYSCPSKRSKYVTKNFGRYMFTSEEDCKEKNVKRKKKSRSRSTERRVQNTKLSQSNTATSKKCIDTGWQEVKSSNKSNTTSHLRKRVHTNVSNNEGTIFEDNDCNHLKAQSSKRSLSPQFDSQSSVASNTMNSENEYTRQDHRDSNAMDNELSSENNTIFDKTKSTSKRKVRFKKGQNKKNQGATINESNTEFNSHDTHYQSSPSRSTSLEKSNDPGNELNSVGKSKAKNGDKSTAAINKSSINVKNYDDTCVNYKPELLKNVKRNLILALEKADSTNNDKGVETDKCVEDELNYNQLLPDVANFNRHSTPLKKTQTSTLKMKELSPDALQDEQKDSGIDEGSQDRIDKIKGSNKTPNRNIKESTKKMPISSPRLKKINKVVETVEDCKEVANDAHLKFNNDDTLGEKISKEEKELSAEEVKNSSQLNQIDTNIETSQENEKDEHFVRAKDSSNIQKQQLLSPKQDCMKEAPSEPCNLIQDEEDDRKVKKPSEEEEEEISLELNKVDNAEVVAEISSINHEEKQDSKEENESSREERKNFLQLSQIDNDAEIHATNHEDQMHFVKSEDSCDTQKQQLLPKIMCTEIVNKKYKLIDKKDNDVKSNIENIDNVNNNTDIEYNSPIKKNMLTHCSDVIDRNTDNWQETTVNREEIDTLMTSETDNEEDNINYMSPQTKKRLQQQARLNLVMSSDSSDSNDEYLTTRTSRTHIYSSDTSEDDSSKNDESNCASQQTKVNISCSEDICMRKEATSVPVEVAKPDSTNMKERIKKKAESLIKCTYENNDSLQSATNKNPLEHKQYSEDVHNDNQSQDESFQLRVSENNISCNSKESINQFRRHKQSSLFDKENMCTKSNQNEETKSTELETRCESEYEQSAQASTDCSNAHLNISCQYRPRNLQELIKDQKLLVETTPASFTLADLSEDDEAFILNVPSKVVQNSLQGQLLTLKEKSLKFNENKYRIVRKEVGTISCIFATGKQHKPYKIVNIKKISTITLREKLPQDSRKLDVSNHYNTVSSEPKSKKKNQQREERSSKMLKVPNHKKRKRIESSDSETEYLRTEKRKNDLFL